jgi:hypothetical protein
MAGLAVYFRQSSASSIRYSKKQVLDLAENSLVDVPKLHKTPRSLRPGHYLLALAELGQLKDLFLGQKGHVCSFQESRHTQLVAGGGERGETR